MKSSSFLFAGRRLMAVLCCQSLALAFSALAGSKTTTPPTGAAAAPEIKPENVWPPQIPQSVFVIPSNPKDGRNPFFPRSAIDAEPTVKPRTTTVDLSAFVLNGITSPPKRTAMINGRTFETGEEGEVRLPGGAKELIKCEEIRADSAVIIVHGQRRELRFRSGF